MIYLYIKIYINYIFCDGFIYLSLLPIDLFIIQVSLNSLRLKTKLDAFNLSFKSYSTVLQNIMFIVQVLCTGYVVSLKHVHTYIIRKTM